MTKEAFERLVAQCRLLGDELSAEKVEIIFEASADVELPASKRIIPDVEAIEDGYREQPLPTRRLLSQVAFRSALGLLAARKFASASNKVGALHFLVKNYIGPHSGVL